MRKRYTIALVTAAGVLAAGGWAYADPLSTNDSETTSPTSTTSAPVTVTLPTGDKVDVPDDAGPVELHPAEGREGIEFFTPTLPGAGRVVIPVDVREAVLSGDSDSRLYDVDALLNHGYTDARDVKSTDSLGEPNLNHDPSTSSKTSKVTFEYTWLDGSVPKMADTFWVNLDTGENDVVMAQKGSATAKLKPGKYGLMHTMYTDMDNPSDIVGTSTIFTVTDDAAKVSVNGEEAKELKFNVDREVGENGPASGEFFVESDKHPAGTGFRGDGETTLHAIPNTGTPQADKTGYSLRAHLNGPDDAYTYNLFTFTEDGIPEDPTTTVHDEDLARRDMTYNSLGNKALMERQNLSYHPKHPPVTYLPGSPVDVGSKRTEFYTADPKVEWSHIGKLPSDDHVLRHSGAMKAGSTEEQSWLSAPLSVGVSDPGFPNYGTGNVRWSYSKDRPEMLIRPPMFTSSSPEETMIPLSSMARP